MQALTYSKPQLAMQGEDKGGIKTRALTHAPIFLNDVSIIGCRVLSEPTALASPQMWGKLGYRGHASKRSNLSLTPALARSQENATHFTVPDIEKSYNSGPSATRSRGYDEPLQVWLLSWKSLLSRRGTARAILDHAPALAVFFTVTISHVCPLSLRRLSESGSVDFFVTLRTAVFLLSHDLNWISIVRMTRSHHLFCHS